MQSTPDPNRRNLYLYLFLGLVFGLLLAGLASVIALLTSHTAISMSNLIQLHLSTPLFLLIDIYAVIFAILFGFIGLQRDKTDYARTQLNWLSQKHSTDFKELNENMHSQDQKFTELEAVISRGKREWEATFDAVKDLVILTDEAGMILRCNRATGEIFNIGFSQLIGRQIDELFQGVMEGAQQGIAVKKTEIQFPEMKGWYEASRNFLMIDGKQWGWVYIFRNISDQKQAMQEVQRLNQYYQLLVKNSPIAIVTLNQDDRVVDCNPAFETLFGFNKGEVLGWNLDSLICPPDLVTETRGLAEAVRQGETTHNITQRQLKNGLLVDVEVFGIPVILGGKQIGALNLYHDISELVGVQQAMLTTRPVEAEWFSESEPPTDGSESLLVEEAANSLETTEVLDEKAGNGIISESPSLVAEGTEPEAGAPEDADELKATFKQRAIPIVEIEGIGPVYTQKLSEADIKTTEDLLDAGKTRKGREELVKKLGVSGVLLLKWVNMADLMRVKGIGEEYSELLEKAGVDTVRELRTRRPDNLHAALIAANEEHKLVRRLPHLSEVESWVRLANDLEPLVTY